VAHKEEGDMDIKGHSIGFPNHFVWLTRNGKRTGAKKHSTGEYTPINCRERPNAQDGNIQVKYTPFRGQGNECCWKVKLPLEGKTDSSRRLYAEMIWENRGSLKNKCPEWKFHEFRCYKPQRIGAEYRCTP
jgi:hypothetical protein